jgi:uroporphyrinogen-III synthase
LQALLDQLAPDHRHLLRLMGQARVQLTPPPGVTLIERVVYASVAQSMPDDLARLLTTSVLAGTVVLLHSAEAAHHFAAECDRLGIARGRLRLAALGPRIAAAAGAGWAGIYSAVTPDDPALLALAGQLCQNRSQAPQNSPNAQPES